MKIEVSEYYADKVKRAYVTGSDRKVCVMVYIDGTKHSMSYAKYLYTSYHKCDIPNGMHVDHINNDKTDDRIENLQVLTEKDNVLKSHVKKEIVERVCPVCKKHFMYEKRNLSTHPNPCCSRHCGGIKSHWK